MSWKEWGNKLSWRKIQLLLWGYCVCWIGLVCLFVWLSGLGFSFTPVGRCPFNGGGLLIGTVIGGLLPVGLVYYLHHLPPTGKHRGE